MTPSEIRDAIWDLLGEYVFLIDSDRLEEFVELFTEDAVYRIVPRENVDLGYPASLLLLENKNMLRDRIAYLRESSVYNIHTDRHLLGHMRYLGIENGAYAVQVNYALYQSDPEGETRLFSVGYYDDKVVFEDDQPKFKEKVVVVDTFAVPTLLSTPI